MYLHARELSVHAENWRQPSIVAPVICLCYITECGCDFLRVCFVKQRSHSCHTHFLANICVVCADFYSVQSADVGYWETLLILCLLFV